MAEILKGAVTGKKIQAGIMAQAALCNRNGVIPTLGIIRVGERSDDVFYEKNLMRVCEKLGIKANSFTFPFEISTEELAAAVKVISDDENVNALMMFSPLPKHIDEAHIRSLISTEKDVDGLTLGSMAGLYSGNPKAFSPCTAQGVIEILKDNDIPLVGANVVVIGRSLVVGKPLALLLLQENATVTICHSRTENLPEICRSADIIVAAIGKPCFVTADFVKPGQVIIDVGMNEDPENPGEYCGDVDFNTVEPIVKAITPVPGGTGSVTTSVLLHHVVQATLNQIKKESSEHNKNKQNKRKIRM